MLKQRLTVCLLILMLLTAACEEETEREGVLAIVDGREITEEDAWYLMNADPGTPVPSEIVDSLVDRELVLREARELDLGRRVSDEQVESYLQTLAATDEVILAGGTAAKRREQFLREQIKRELTYDAVLESEVLSQIEIGPAEIEAYYADHRERFSVHPIAFRQIVVEDEQSAAEVTAELEAGGDFAELAAEYGTTPEAENGGLIELQKREDLPAALLSVLETLEPGEVSEPVNTDWGVHLLKLEESGESAVRPLAEVRDEIHDLLFEEASVAEREQWLQGLRAAAEELIWRAPVDEDAVDDEPAATQ